MTYHDREGGRIRHCILYCCGIIELKFYVKSRGLVWCALNPSNVKDYKEVMEGNEVNIDLTSTS